MNKQSIPFGEALGIEVAYSNAVSIDLTESTRMVFVSGQLAFNSEGQLVGKDDISVQTEQCIKNITEALSKFDGSLDDVVQVVVYVTQMNNLADIHKVRLKHFKKPYPTSTLIQVSGFVNTDALIEIEAKAIINIKRSE